MQNLDQDTTFFPNVEKCIVVNERSLPMVVFVFEIIWPKELRHQKNGTLVILLQRDTYGDDI